jgi:L-ribulose-5-phosphate 3-epimerase
MLTGISYWSFRKGLAQHHPLYSAIQEAKDAGFDAIELCIAERGVFTPQTTRLECEEIRRLAGELGIQLQTMASGMSWSRNPVSDDPNDRETSRRHHEAALNRAAWIGASDLLYVPGIACSPFNGSVVRYDRAMSRMRENVTELLAVASALEVHLCIETVWNGLFYSPLELRDFIDSFSSPWLGVYLDLGNLIGCHQYPPHWIEILNQRVRRVHVKDFQISMGSAQGFCELGEGDVPWEESLSALRAAGYDETLVAEIIPWREGVLESTQRKLEEIITVQG